MINHTLFSHTKSKINYNLEGKEFILQCYKRRYRCISWHPHYITTEWAKTKDMAIYDGDKAIKRWENRIKA